MATRLLCGLACVLAGATLAEAQPGHDWPGPPQYFDQPYWGPPCHPPLGFRDRGRWDDCRRDRHDRDRRDRDDPPGNDSFGDDSFGDDSFGDDFGDDPGGSDFDQDINGLFGTWETPGGNQIQLGRDGNGTIVSSRGMAMNVRWQYRNGRLSMRTSSGQVLDRRVHFDGTGGRLRMVSGNGSVTLRRVR